MGSGKVPPITADSIDNEDGEKSLYGDDDDIGIVFDGSALIISDEANNDDVLKIPADGSADVTIPDRNLAAGSVNLGDGVENNAGSLKVSTSGAISIDGSGNVSVTLGDGVKLSGGDIVAALGGGLGITNGNIEPTTGSTITLDGSGNLVVVPGNINHDNLSSIGSSDHHSKTSQASELSDVSPDSAANAHHSKDHASRHSSGGGDAVSLSNLDASGGTSGQVLETDGSSASWANSLSGAEIMAINTVLS